MSSYYNFLSLRETLDFDSIQYEDIKYLHIDQVVDIKILKRFKQVICLQINSSLVNLVNLSHCDSIRHIIVVNDHSPLTNLQFLELYPNIIELRYLRGKLTSLTSHQNLERLVISHNPISSIDKISDQFPKLLYLDITNTNITDLNPLGKCKILKSLVYNPIKIESYKEIKNCKTLISPYPEYCNYNRCGHLVDSDPDEDNPVCIFINKVALFNNNYVTCYEDNENSMFDSIEESVIKAIEYLKEIKTDVNISDNSEIIHSIMHNDAYDEYVETYQSSVRDVFKLVYSRIKKEPEAIQDELFKRLYEETQEFSSNKICNNGKIVRLINTLVGFDDKIQLRFSDSEQLSAIIINERRKLNPYDRDLHYTNVMKLVADLNIDQSIIDEWVQYI